MFRSCHHPIEVPAVRDTFQLVLAGVCEGDPTPRDEILHRGRDEHFRRTREGGDTSPDVDGDAATLPPMSSHSPVCIRRGSPARAHGPLPIGWPHRTARAGPSNVASNPSPVVSISVPGIDAICARPPRGGARAALSMLRRLCSRPCSVDPTMSVNSTVASTRSNTACSACRVAEKLTISRSIVSAGAYQKKPPPPSTRPAGRRGCDRRDLVRSASRTIRRGCRCPPGRGSGRGSRAAHPPCWCRRIGGSCDVCPRSVAVPLHPKEPLSLGRAAEVRPALPRATTPRVADALVELLPPGSVGHPGCLFGAHVGNVRVHEDEAGDLFGMSGCEELGDQAGVIRGRDDRRSLLAASSTTPRLPRVPPRAARHSGRTAPKAPSPGGP